MTALVRRLVLGLALSSVLLAPAVLAAPAAAAQTACAMAYPKLCLPLVRAVGDGDCLATGFAFALTPPHARWGGGGADTPGCVWLAALTAA